jgi:predicted RNA-binding protein
MIQHEYIVRDANETPIEEFKLDHHIVDEKFEVQMRKQKIFTSHIELTHCFLNVDNYDMANEHLSEALKIAAKVENRM